jgi:hypothetical protein
MEWEDILPQRGRKVTASPGVTVSWRVPTKGHAKMHVTIGNGVTAQLGWTARDRVRVQRNVAAGLLRLAKGATGDGTYALHGAPKSSVLAAGFPFVGMEGLAAQKATPVEYRVVDGALVLDLPAWARSQAQVAKPAQPPAASRPLVPELLTAKPPASAQPAAMQPASTRPPRQGRERRDDAPTAADAKTPDAQDVAEAKQMLRRGKSVREVAEEFGFKMSVIQGWQDEVRAERGKAA